ncbi:mannose-1-phosphate guanylyltransferase [Fonticula alba]|uniref:mannose-1-phosphate guanylyltransferase n=1 Tax=Fonticula alba TaxID=691883 RepID=A0A058ZD26_FONAL|nr:mannose-1-phosphate guanylyltransferase [Fonticula alba]KCV71342.1 mannose-1-phosphate guanylyltransferase [Fonticula alba]|eukprot:XP_009494465.1 mannose-1-phosphate guanylyltransferase [Fonticula alba]
MKALILVGGFGTRLRPLTLTLPKPLVPFSNRPMIEIQIDALAKAGVTDVILAVNYRPDIMMAELEKFEKKYNIKIHFSVEQEPLGTAGPLALARDLLLKDPSPFFVLNSDIICPFPLSQMAEFHRQHGRAGTIAVTRVEDPSKYGVVVAHPHEPTLVERFVEKPSDFVSNRINAGIYILDISVLDRIELRPTSIEKEIFPSMASDNQLCCMDLEGYWMDVGQPADYLSGIGLHLAHMRDTEPASLATGPHIVGNVLIHPTATVAPDCLLGPNVTVGPNARIESGARIRDSALLDHAHVQAHARVAKSIVGWQSRVGRWARLDQVTVLGLDVQVSEEVFVNGARVLPHKTISDNVYEPSIIM